MSKGSALSGTALNLYRAGVIAGITAILWLMANFVTKERFTDYQSAHEKWGNEVISGLRADILLQRGQLTRIETKLDEFLREHKVLLRIQDAPPADALR